MQNTPGLPAQTFTLEPPGQSAAAPTSLLPQPQPSKPACSNYTAPVSIGGQPRQAAIEACPLPDGSWTITQSTPGLPTQVYQVPAPSSSPYPYRYPYPVDYAYPEFFPYWAGAPWYFGLAPSIVVCRGFGISTMASPAVSGTGLRGVSGRVLAAAPPSGAAADGIDFIEGKRMSVQAIGQPVRREEDLRLLKGSGRYVDDVRSANEARGYVLRSPHAHARMPPSIPGRQRRPPGCSRC